MYLLTAKSAAMARQEVKKYEFCENKFPAINKPIKNFAQKSVELRLRVKKLKIITESS